MENYTDFELMLSRSINKMHDARRQLERGAAVHAATEAPTTEAPTTEAPTIPVNADVKLKMIRVDVPVADVLCPEDHCPMCGLGPHAPISQGLVLIDEDTKLNPNILKHYSCRGCGWWWSNKDKGGEE
jgi:hypothetical protein